MLNEKQGYMRDKMKKWFAAWCGLTAACAMTTSCSMMQDDLDDCPTGLYLSFKYDYNLQRADMFNDHVGAVTVYVFDEEGRYVTKQEEANVPGHAPLSSPLYTMRMNLAPGKYKFLVLAGQKDYEAQLAGGGARFVRREPGAGDAMEGALDVTLDRVAGASGWEVAPASGHFVARHGAFRRRGLRGKAHLRYHLLGARHKTHQRQPARDR